MTERFVENTGTISITSGTSTVTGTGTLFSGRDRAGAHLYAIPAAAAPFLVGIVAEVDPRGEYENLELPLVQPYNGTTLTNEDFALVDGLAIASGATQAAIFARYAAFLEQNAGLIFNSEDDVDTALMPNNSLVVDDAVGSIEQWRGGVLVPIMDLSATIEAAASKTTPVDADKIPLIDSAAANVLKKFTWANLKATLKTPRVQSISSSATPTINTDSCDFVTITALATAITSMTTNLSGTPTNGQKLVIRIKDDGSARSITWGASFEAAGVALPTTTIISKRLTVDLIYDTVTSKWGCVALAQEA